VDTIEGIGPATAAALAAGGVTTVFDLLRHSSAELHEMVATIASRERVRQWRHAAALLPVTVGDAQFAEALVAGGLFSMEMVSATPFEGLAALFAAAEADGTIPAVPGPGEIAAMMATAAVMDVTGHCAGEVILADGTPAAGASVSLGERSTTTDPYGHFRIIGVPLDSAADLRITLDGREPLQVPRPELVREPATLLVPVYQLPAAAGVAAGPQPPAALELSELAGDELPPLSNVPVRTVRHSAAELREGDILVWRETLVRAPRERLLSRFLRYSGGELLVDLYAVDTASLPANAAIGTHFEVRAGALVEVPMNRRLLHARKVARRRRAAFANWSGPLDAAGARALLDAMLAYGRAHALNAASGDS